MQSFLAAAVQMTASDTKEDNLQRAESFVRRASKQGAALYRPNRVGLELGEIFVGNREVTLVPALRRAG